MASPRPRAELVVVLASAATFGALLAASSVFRPVRDSIVLDGDPDRLPWLFTTSFAAVSVVSPAWSALLAGRARRRLIAPVYHVFAACAVLFGLAVYAELDRITVGRVFYVWAAVFNLFVVSVFWSLLADLFAPGAARRLYGPIAAGGTIGTVVGPALTKLLVHSIGNAGVILLSAALLELAVLGVAVVRRAARALPRDPEQPPDQSGDQPSDEPAPPSNGGPFTGIAHVVRSPYLSSIVGYVLCTACAATFVYLAQADIAKRAIPSATARTEYFATVDLWVAAITFLLQTVVASPAIGRLGPGVVLAVLPVAQAIGISVLALAPSLAALTVVQAISRSATHGLTRPARELLFTVLDRDDKYRAKHAIDTIGYRLGDFGSSWLNLGLKQVGASAVAIAAIPLAVIWLALASRLGAAFRRRSIRAADALAPSGSITSAAVAEAPVATAPKEL